jgi:hypothetical protein
MPPLTSQKGIGFSYGSRLPTSTILPILPGISRVPTVGLKRDDVGGVFLDAPSALCGSPDCPQGRTGLPVAPFGHGLRLTSGFYFFQEKWKFRLSGWHIRQGMPGSALPVGLCTLRATHHVIAQPSERLLDTCLLLTSPFRSMLLTVRGGPQCLAPRAHGAPACPKVLRHSYRELSRRTFLPL